MTSYAFVLLDKEYIHGLYIPGILVNMDMDISINIKLFIDKV